MNPDREQIISVEELRMLLGAIRKSNEAVSQRDYEWISLILNTGIKPGVLRTITLEQARSAVLCNILNVGEDSFVLTDAASASLSIMIGIAEELNSNPKPDSPLLLSRNRKAISVRALEQSLRKWCDNAFLQRRITINHLIYTHRAKAVAEQHLDLVHFYHSQWGS